MTNVEITNPEKEFKRVGFEGYVAALCVKGIEIWTGGEQLVVLTKDMWKKELTQRDPRSVITALVLLHPSTFNLISNIVTLSKLWAIMSGPSKAKQFKCGTAQAIP